MSNREIREALGRQALAGDHGAAVMLRHLGQREQGVRYDYDRQTWLRGDLVLPCGHPTPHATCYACAHAGERVPS